jgi:protein gp37
MANSMDKQMDEVADNHLRSSGALFWHLSIVTILLKGEDVALNKTGISWTEEILNSLYGCKECSKGCAHCYAVNRAFRFSKNPALNRDGRFSGLVKVIDKTVVENGKKKQVSQKYFTGRILFNPGRLYAILKARKPKKVFVNEFSDLLHPAVPMEVILEHFRVFQAASWHTFQILTKRADRLRELDKAIRNEFGDWPRNVWQGVSVCSQAKIEMKRIVDLGRTAAKVKWISFEPWLSESKMPLQEAYPELFNILQENQISWTVIGGESGTKAQSRIMTLDDARYLFAASRKAGCKVHFKQLGTRLAEALGVYSAGAAGGHRSKGGNPDQIPSDLAVQEWPSFSAGEYVAIPDFKRQFNPIRWKHFKSAKD